MAIKSRRGQAMIELAAGMFALALVVSMLCVFAVYIAKSLKIQNKLRVGNASASDKVEVSEFAAKHLFGASVLKIDEKVEMPNGSIMR